MLRPTYSALVDLAERYHVVHGPRVVHNGHGGVNLAPLLDMVAAHLAAFLEQLPPDVRGRFDRNRKLSADQVRRIRASTDKVVSIASEEKISEGMVSMIRNRKRYQWVV